jgi:aspartyl-tRNA(Asn)/glutamyl-tRNA(Gln) amidotransferase subunit B
VLTATREVADYFEAAWRQLGDAKAASNWVMGEVLRELKERKLEITAFEITPDRLAGLIAEVQSGRINMPTAKDVFREMARTDGDAREIIDKRGLQQISDEGELDAVIDQVLEGQAKEVARYLAGEERLLKFLVGQVMKLTKGKANPQKATARLKESLEKRRD